MILLDEYFQDSITNYAYEPTVEERVSCLDLLERANKMVEDFVAATGAPEPQMTSGHRCKAKTDALIAEGYHAVHNDAHEHAAAIDLGDAEGKLDDWLDDDKLATYGLYREAPSATHGWTHVQNVPPHSHHRTFYP